MKTRMNNSKVYCNHIQKGLFVSHRGIGLCCTNPDKNKDILPSEFWSGPTRSNALIKMNNGDPVKGCHNCYKTEANRMNSPRTFAHIYDDLPTMELPTHLDLDFSNFCNLKCVMCDLTRSSEWAKDVGESVSTVTKDMLDDLAGISDHVQRICIQGGEPTIMPEFEYYFSLLEQKGLIKNIELMMITNATNVNAKFYELLKGFKKVRLTVSVDAYGMANDYIRWPSNFSQIERNLMKMSDLPKNMEVEIFNTLNMLSMFNYGEFLEWCKKIEKVFDRKGKLFKIVPMKVEGPKKYSPFCAPTNLKNKLIADVKTFMEKDNLNHNSNWKTETMMIMKRLDNSAVDPEVLEDLKKTVTELDKERNKKITDYIPDFYKYI